MATKKINTKDITRDPRTQMREKDLDPAVVNEYALAMENGDEFPPIVVFSADGKSAPYYLADGWYRTAAAEKAYNADPKVGVMIDANVRKGGIREAVLFAVGANSSHGLRRTNADKRKAVKALLADDEWTGWSDGVIAKRANVSQPFVSTLRRETEKLVDEDKGSTQKVLSAAPAKRKGADGVMRKTHKAKRKAAKPPPVADVQVTDKRRVTEESQASAPVGPAPGMIADGNKEKKIASLITDKPLYISFTFIPKVADVAVSVHRGVAADASRLSVAPSELPRMTEPIQKLIIEQLERGKGN